MSENATGQPCVELVCPECGHSELASIGPTLSIGGTFDVTVTEVHCSRCDYEGPPGESDREDTPLDDLPFDIAAGDNPFVAFAEWWVGNGSDWATVAMMLAEAKKTAQANAMNEASQEDSGR